MADQSSKMPAFSDTQLYWKVLREEHEKDKFDMMTLMWDIYRDFGGVQLCYDDGDPISWFMDKYGANALYFTLPDEFANHMEYEMYEVLAEQETLETDKNLLEVMERFVNSLSKK